MSYSFDRGLTWTCLSAALALAACGGATSSPETVPDASVADGKTTTSHDSGTKTDTGTKTDAKTTIDAKTTTPDAKMTTEDTGVHTDAAGCPASAPMDRSACTTTGETCAYTTATDTSNCTCAGGMIGWVCRSCPTAQPTAGAACTAMGGGGMGGGGGGAEACTYGATDCECTAGAWNCGTCPATEPTAGDTCDLAGELCTYTAGDCRCGGGGGKKIDAGTMTDGGTTTDGAVMATDGGGMTAPTEAWRCGDPCPTAQPMTGAACTTLQGEACKYGTTTCDCAMGKFACN